MKELTIAEVASTWLWNMSHSRLKRWRGKWDAFIKNQRNNSLKGEQRNARDCVDAREIEVLNGQQCRRIGGKALRKGSYEFSVKVLTRVSWTDEGKSE